MLAFRKILFVSDGLADDGAALTQALHIARADQASLSILIAHPALPDAMEDYAPRFESSLKERVLISLREARAALALDPDDEHDCIETDAGSSPATRVIRHVLRRGYDLVIKRAAVGDGGRGFKAVDMELLRKCPCPLWLSRPVARPWRDMRVSVAIDPESLEPEGRDLSLQLLRVGRQVADTCSGELNVVSCWDFEHEGYLRQNAWFRVSDAEVTTMVLKRQSAHQVALQQVIADAAVGDRLQVQRMKGPPESMIPQHIVEQDIDLLVMGTVARTGLPGFFIGNTAENVLRELGCSLLAMKPMGFVSPVTAY
jgi:nucleotide-binding universal stress UspA family protein